MTGVGIDAYGCALPLRRLTRAAVRQAGWNAPAGWNFSPVPEPDEDALTLACQACQACASASGARQAGAEDAEPIGSIGIASTTLPYRRRVQAGLLVEALRLEPGVFLTEHTTSSRAGTEALMTHASQVAARGGAALVTAGEAPIGADRGLDESGLAVALRLGRGGRVARLDGAAYRAAEYPGLDFQGAPDPSPRRDVQVPDYSVDAYTTLLTGAVHGLLAQLRTEVSALRTVVLAGVAPSLAGKGASLLGLAPQQWRSAVPYGAIGDAGAAGALFGLVAALDVAQEGDRILLTSYGAGSALDAIALTAGPAAGQGLLARQLAGFVDLDLPQFLRLRGGR